MLCKGARSEDGNAGDLFEELGIEMRLEVLEIHTTSGLGEGLCHLVDNVRVIFLD